MFVPVRELIGHITPTPMGAKADPISALFIAVRFRDVELLVSTREIDLPNSI